MSCGGLFLRRDYAEFMGKRLLMRRFICPRGAHGHLKVSCPDVCGGLFLRRDYANAIRQRLLTRRFIGPQIRLV
jgi:hypothetical protein